jgi:hypothetical protein
MDKQAEIELLLRFIEEAREGGAEYLHENLENLFPKFKQDIMNDVITIQKDN